jgi:chromosome partitioning protein
MAVTITIANEKGGVGKTTTAVNLAAGLAMRLADREGSASRVLLVDMDPQGHALLAVAPDHQKNVPTSRLASLLVETPPPSVQRMIQRSEHLANLSYLPSDRNSMIHASHELPTLMANETRLARALAPIQDEFAYIIIDTPPNTGDLLVNALVSADYVLIPVETSYLGVSGLIELERTIDQVRMHFKPQIQIFGYLPTLVEEQRIEVQEILSEMTRRYGKRLLKPIHKSSDLAYAHSSHMDVFTYRPPRQRTTTQIASSSRPTQEYADLVNNVLLNTQPSTGRKPA